MSNIFSNVRRAVVVLALLAVTCLTDEARGVITTTLAPVPIAAAAIAADPALADMQTWDLRVHVPQGENWGTTGFLAQLSGGSFYNSPLGANWPMPQAWAAFPQLRYDTFVTHAADPADDSTFRAPAWNFSGYPDVPAPVEFTPTRTSIVFLALYGVFTGPGEFTVARLTFSDDAMGTMVGFTTERPTGATEQWNFTIPVPEPASCGVVLLGLVSLVRRRR